MRFRKPPTNWSPSGERYSYQLGALSLAQGDIDYSANLLEQTIDAHPKGVANYNRLIRQAEIACAQGNLEARTSKLG